MICGAAGPLPVGGSLSSGNRSVASPEASITTACPASSVAFGPEADWPFHSDTQYRAVQPSAGTDECAQRAFGGQGVFVAGNSCLAEHLRGLLKMPAVRCPENGHQCARRQHRRPPRRRPRSWILILNG